MEPKPGTHGGDCSRRTFLAASSSAALGSALLGAGANAANEATGPAGGQRVRAAGPASKYVPALEVAFVRRAGEYGMRWPGAIYDGQVARARYQGEIEQTARQLGMRATIRPTAIHSLDEADQWVTEAAANKPDGLLVVLLDRQEHAWPSATKAIDAGIPTVVFAPLGAAFTTNTRRLADRTGCFICSTSDFAQAAYGLRMIAAAARLRETRYIVLRGNERRDTHVKHFGTKLRYVPAQEFLDEYRRTDTTDEVKAIAREYVKNATGMTGTTFEDVCNGVKSYVVARTILQREEGDAITMDCLGALGHTKVSLPCIAWSRMMDHGIPAACEADVTACVTQALTQYLFDRPGFQQDPVAETARDCLIGAHCSCPTRLNGFAAPAEPYRLSPHHGKRDAVPVTQWRVGQRMTVLDVMLSKTDDVPPTMIISSGTVVENVSVPPAGGCVVSVMVKLDGVDDTLAYPGFHQLFIYGDYRKELASYAKLFGIQPMVV